MRTLTKIFIVIIFTIQTLNVKAWNAPTISSPSNGANVWTGVTLDWNSVAGSEFYQIQIDTTSNFNSSALIQATNAYINSSSGNSDTKYDASDLYFGKTYYWRVRAYISGDTSAWAQSTFITLNYVQLSTPSNGSLNWTGLTLDWNSHPTVDFYDIELDTTSNFNSPLLIQATNAYINSSGSNSDTKYDASDLYFGKTYYWRVRARNNIDTSVWTVRNFETIDYVELSTPSNGSLNWTGLTLDWDAHPSVNLYHFQFDTISTFSSPFLINQNIAYINSSSNNADTKYSTGALLANEVYYWRVRAINDVDTSAWTIRYFSTGNCQDPGLISGATEICEESENAYSITPVTGAISYNWLLPSGWIGNSTTNSISATSSSNSGTIKVSVNNSCGVSSEQTLYVSVNQLPVAAGTISGDATVCQGQNSVIYNVPTIDNATSYIWTLPSGATGTSTTNSISVDYGTSAISGNITVKGTNDCGEGAESSLAITVNPLPSAAGTISGDATVCQGQNSVIYNVPTIDNATSYIWTLPSGATGTSTTNSISVDFGTSAISGNITVKGTNDCGEGAESSLAITVNPLPSAAGTISGDATVCQGQNSVIYNVPTIDNATSYIWTLPSGATGTSTTNSISVDFGTSAISGNISVKGTNDCSEGAISALPITVNTIPNTPIVTLNGLVLHSDAPLGNQWYNQNGILIGETNQDLSVTSNGDYYCIVTLNGCSSNTSNIINVVIVGIVLSENDNYINLYPNPVSNELTVEIEGNNEIKSVILINSFGQEIYKDAFINRITISTANYSSGIYLVKIGNDNSCELRKIVIKKY